LSLQHSSIILRRLRQLRGVVRQFRLRLDYAQVCGPLAFGGRPRRLIRSYEPCHLQRGPYLSPYEVSTLDGGNIFRQQFDRRWPLPPPLLVGELAACWGAEFWHPPPTFDFNFRSAPCASRCLRASARGMLPRKRHLHLSVRFIVIYVIVDAWTACARHYALKFVVARLQFHHAPEQSRIGFRSLWEGSRAARSQAVICPPVL
jgi:hypothetical protein